MRKTGCPSRDELVVCRITKIYPNSAFAELVEYGKSGMIHVSEVASRWVRDIREFLKENQYVVCKVMRIEGDNIHLSVKRVQREQANSKLNEFKRERKAEKLLELAGKELGKDLEESYRIVGNSLWEEFGSLSKAFEIARKDPELMKSKGIPGEWVDALSKIAQKSFVEKSFTMKIRLKLASYSPDGIDIIKKALQNALDAGFEVKYISAPEYLMVGNGKDAKKLEASLEKTAQDIMKEIKQGGGEGSFEAVK
jgi:translation initiation factor 2 subunit 1